MGCSAITGYRFRSCLVDTDVHRRPGEPPAEGYVYTGYPTLENMPAGSYFSFGTAFSIISGSKNVDEAWEFIRFCLSPEQQRSVRGGMPVNSRVLQERIDERLENKEITEADAECFDELLDETEWGPVLRRT